MREWELRGGRGEGMAAWRHSLNKKPLLGIICTSLVPDPTCPSAGLFVLEPRWGQGRCSRGHLQEVPQADWKRDSCLREKPGDSGLRVEVSVETGSLGCTLA